MQEVVCDQSISLHEYLDVNNYHIYDGASGRVTSTRVYQDDEIVAVDDPGNYHISP